MLLLHSQITYYMILFVSIAVELIIRYCSVWDNRPRRTSVVAVQLLWRVTQAVIAAEDAL